MYNIQGELLLRRRFQLVEDSIPDEVECGEADEGGDEEKNAAEDHAGIVLE